MSGLQILLLIDSIFIMIGFVLILIGILIYRARHGKKVVEINAKCVEVKVEDYKYSDTPDRVLTMKNTKTPIYEYTYNGEVYRSSPSVHSNMPGYDPKVGPCRIRINREQPQKIYYSQSNFVSVLLIGLGIFFIVSMIVVSLFVFFLGKGVIF